MNNFKSIFVSIASYRDKYCSKTLESCFSNAKNPNNIYVGICIQNDEKDEDCTIHNESLKQFNKNIQTIKLKHHEAKGPTWARYLCATLFNNEDYFFQIDSHILFRQNWDEILINMLQEIKDNTDSKNIVISHYPPSYSDHNNKKKENHSVDTICQSFFNERGVVSFLGAESMNMKEKKYIKTPHIAGGMVFSEGTCIKDVPYDPNLPYLFVGEEILHSARIWTSGYDIYTPTENTVYHLYTRTDQPHIWNDKKYSDEDATNKVKYLMNFDKNVKDKIPEHVMYNIEKYGLGKTRTLDEYLEYAGINVNDFKITKNFCKPFVKDESRYKPSQKNNPIPNNNQMTTQMTTLESLTKIQSDFKKGKVKEIVISIIMLCVFIFILCLI